MVTTRERRPERSAFFANDRCAAMAARVVESADPALAVAQDDDWRPGLVPQEIAAGRGELVDVPCVEPRLSPQTVSFELKERGIRVATGRQVGELRKFARVRLACPLVAGLGDPPRDSLRVEHVP